MYGTGVGNENLTVYLSVAVTSLMAAIEPACFLMAASFRVPPFLAAAGAAAGAVVGLASAAGLAASAGLAAAAAVGAAVGAAAAGAAGLAASVGFGAGAGACWQAANRALPPRIEAR